eukprot:scaffold175446_cov34-Prasinocladus_malaysianus.AAC.1
MVSSIPAPPGSASSDRRRSAVNHRPGSSTRKSVEFGSSKNNNNNAGSSLRKSVDVGNSQLPWAPGKNKQDSGKSTLKKDMGKAMGLKIEDVDTADVERLKAAAANAIQLEERLMEVEVERATELRELQEMMSSLQAKEEELS